MQTLSAATNPGLFISPEAFSTREENERKSIDFNEKFLLEYVFGDRKHALKEYLENPAIEIDANYKEGIFFIKAAEEGDLETLKLLIENSSVEVETEFLLEALSRAADKGHISCADFLITQGADPNQLKGIAVYSNHKSMEAFLNTKVKGATSNDHFIYEYVYGNEEEAIVFLNNSDIDINYKNGRFLQEAVQQGDVKVVELLLKKGANVGLERALDIATRNKDNACSELLIAYGAIPNHLENTTDSANKEAKVLFDRNIVDRSLGGFIFPSTRVE